MKQLTIVHPNRPGILAEITEALAESGVNLESFDAQQVGGMAVIILTVDQYDKALQALSRTPFSAVTEDALLVRLEDRPGALATLARRFRDAGIDLRSVRIVHSSGGQTLAAIATERTNEAMALVKDVLVA